jgi:serine protease Do
MKKLLLLLTILCVGSVGAEAQTKTNDPVAQVRAVAGGLVRVEYELQYDQADEPSGGLGGERCPSCGQYHGESLRTYLEEERPVAAAGYLVAPDRVVTADPQLHPRFIKSITVRFGDQATTATVASYGRDHKAVVLNLGKPLAGAKPLSFKSPVAGEFHIINYQRENAHWTATVHPLPKQVSVPDGETPHRLVTLSGVVVTEAGLPVGLLLGTRIGMDQAWQGSPLNWPMLSVADFTKLADQLQAASRASLVRVGLSFRSPKSSPDDFRGGSRYSGSDFDEEGGGMSTERSVLGLVWDNNRVLVLANLKPRQTARLDRITVFPASGAAVSAQFVASLKTFGALVVKLDQTLPGAVKISSAAPRSWGDQLLLRADVAVQGETRTDYFMAERIASCTVGWQGRVYPELNGGENDNAFLFSSNLELVALPLVRREQISGGRDSYRSADVELTPASYVAEAMRGLPASGDISNVPVSEEEENRLAWLGVELQPLNRELARANGISAQTRDGETGALVTFVHPDSPAAEAKVPVGAVLLRLQVPGQPLPVEVTMEEDYRRAQPFPWDRLDEVTEQYFDRIPTPWSPAENSFTRALTDLGFGTRFTAEFIVDGKMVAHEFDVVVGPTHYDSASRYKAESVGLTVRDISYDVRRYLQRQADEPGVVISKIEPGSKASVAGIKPYEVITHINEKPVRNVKDFETLIGTGGELKLSLKRMARGRIVSLTTDAK